MVGGVLADRAVRVKGEANADRHQARDGAAAGSFSETLKPRCRRIATAFTTVSVNSRPEHSTSGNQPVWRAVCRLPFVLAGAACLRSDERGLKVRYLLGLSAALTQRPGPGSRRRGLTVNVVHYRVNTVLENE